ncbi:MAG TPA: RagB/SusD family nutrient uptake outer membrane protein [Gemmatimonadaceae bacterium]|nr:RagB/SusD family nutrient uptake outer membrane protein [Gemmatimonadaceae bacterium]
MTTRAITAFAAAMLLVGAACTDVTTEPKSTVTAANVFNDASSYRAFLAKLYGGLAVTGQQGPAGQGDIEGIDEGFSQYIRGYWQLQELPTDEVVIGWGDESLPEMNTMGWSSSNRFITAFYYRIFYQVALANEFLRETTDERLASRGASAELRTTVQQYRAEARLLRALSYWHGLDLFGSVPLVTEEGPIGAEPPAQATRQQLFQFVESEINAVRAALPAAGAAEYGRFDQAVADMILAKLYLNAQVYAGTARWSDALTAAQRVIASNAFTLDDRYMDMFLADNHTSPELIYAVPFDGNATRTYGGTTFLAHAAVGGSMNADSYGLNGGWWGLRVTPQFVALFPGAPASADRRSAILYTEGQTLAIDNISNFNHGYAAPKYQNVTSAGGKGKNSEFPDTDFPMFRLADAYLMYAEAVLRGGGGTRAQALTYVNALRTRAYGNASGNITDAQLTLDFILAERSRELYMEAHRRTDLIRYGLFTGGQYLWAWKGNTAGGTATAAHLNLYPIPASDLLANPKLTQNPGY